MLTCPGFLYVGTTNNGDDMEVSRSVYILEIYPTETDQDVVSFPSHVPVSTEGSGLLCLFASLSTPQSGLPGQRILAYFKGIHENCFEGVIRNCRKS